MSVAKFETVEAYLGSFPEEVRPILEQIRTTIRVAVPGAEETISYDIPTFKLDGKALIYVAAWKQHIAVYPVPTGDEALQHDVEGYRSGKGTLRFQLTEPFPYELFDRLVQAAVAER